MMKALSLVFILAAAIVCAAQSKPDYEIYALR